MSEVSSKEVWLAPHFEIYQRLLKALETEPKNSAEQFLKDRAPALLRETYGAINAYAFNDDLTGVGLRTVSDGDQVVKWTGRAFESGTHSEFDAHVSDYFDFAERVIAIADSLSAPMVLDLGAGTCLQTVALRAKGSALPVLNLDYFDLAIGRKLVELLSLENVAFGHVDVVAALSSPATAADLKRTILEAAAGRPVIVLTRMSIFGFMTEPEYQRLFAFLLNDLGVAAGLHLEICGHKTSMFQKMRAMRRNDLRVASKCLQGHGEPLEYLASLDAVEVVERQEIWPHILSTRFPSFLSWRRA